jgi:hypothetical protein
MKLRKDIYYEFKEKFSSKLTVAEVAIFENVFPNYKKIGMTMFRWRKEGHPGVPLTQTEVKLDTAHSKKKNGENLVIGDSIIPNRKAGFGRVVTFGNPAELHRFGDTNRLNIDCTYKTAPKPAWAAILVFQAKVGTCWAPITITWLPDESQESFREGFRQVREAVENSGAKFTQNCEVMMDFDSNMRNAYMLEIGNKYSHDLRGCSFHFGQCIYTWVNVNGFSQDYRGNEDPELQDTIHAALG